MTDEPALHPDSEMSLFFAFEDQSASYVHGFEAGQVSARIQNGEQEIDLGYENGFPAHTANIETFKRMAQAYGYKLETKATDYEEWTAARFTVGTPKPALKIVK